MLTRVAAFEFNFQRGGPVFYASAAIFFLLTFGAVTVEQVQIGAGGNVFANSPYAIAQTHLILSLFFMFTAAAMVAGVVLRDDETGFGPIIRTTRIGRDAYLFGRFTGALLAAALALAAVPLAIFIGSLMPWLDPETLGANRLRDYGLAYGVLALPNLFVTGALFFALATVTRSMLGTYLGVIGLLAIYLVLNIALGPRPELERTLAVLDPFGLAAFEQATRYQSAAERNTEAIALEGLLLWNRLLWLLIGCVALLLARLTFRFEGLAERGSSAPHDEPEPTAPATAGVLPAPRFDRHTALAQLGLRCRLEMRQIFSSPAFGILVALGLFNAGAGLWFSGEMFGTPRFPVTHTLIPVLIGTFSLVPLIIAIYYAGELVWRERDCRLHEIVDAAPIPNWAYVVPKTLAVTLVLVATVAFGMLAAIAVQLVRGYTHFELDKYVLWYLLPTAFDMVLLAALAVFVQALSPNKYTGWGVMALFLVATLVLFNVGMEHPLILYSSAPEVPLSDMNGAGHYWQAAWWLRLYWGAAAILLLVAAHLLWRRGTETRLTPRLRRAPARLRGAPGAIAAAAALVFVATGSWVFYNTNVLNDYFTERDHERFMAEYERRHLVHATLPQPTITHVELDVELYPEQLRAEVSGRYMLTNETGEALEEVHVRSPDRRLKLREIELSGAELDHHDEDFDYRIYRLPGPLQPGDTLELTFRSQREVRGFPHANPDTRLVHNGTFLNNFEIAPVIGMDRWQLLRDRSVRRRNDLPADLRPPALEDDSATVRPYFGGGWSTADITVTTSADQTPIAPGRRVEDATDDGRRRARFVSDAPILTFFSIQSARYAERRREHNGVDLVVYHHPGHDWNVERMLDALAHGLDYFTEAFGPYQFQQARIIEFPGYERFAQAFANTMPYSESIGFIADSRDPEKIDYVTYVTAHELAHQWWAHQVIGADTQGATVLSETLAQYSALMVMRHMFGADHIRRFLKYELDSYLRARGGEAVEELPLARVEDQGYIHYQKGSLVMYLLQERLGEDAVNRALRRLIERYGFQSAPYPRSTDLIAELRAEAQTDAEQQLITDLFEKITLYELRTVRPTARELDDGRFEVRVPVVAHKFYADGLGAETETPLSEEIEIGLFTDEPGRAAFDADDVILMERREVVSGEQTFTFVTDRRPTHAGIDPYNFYIVRNAEDNSAPVRRAE